MKGMAKSKKVVTSGRLTGRVKMKPVQRQVIPNPGAAPCPEPAFSLYSADCEDQVTSLHTGLDRCAALLSGILQAEKAEVVKSPPRVVKSTAAKSRPSNSLGKRTIKKAPTQTEQKTCWSVQHVPGSATPRTRHQSAVPAAHAGVKLHPPHEQTGTLPHSLLHCHTLKHISSTPSPQPIPHSGQTPSEAPHTHYQSECDREEEDIVPVRDIGTQSTATDTLTAVRQTHSHTCTSTFKMSNKQLGSGKLDNVSEDTDSRENCSAETEMKGKTGEYLLGQLKALITGQGSVAERLLSDLEQTVFLPSMNVGSSNIQTEPDLSSLHNQNTQLRRRVRTLNQQLKETEKAGRQNNETLCNSEVFLLQEELTTAQLRQQELQDDLTELRKALQDTQSQLKDREAKNALIKSDLDTIRSRLLDSEREKSELASIAQQRLEEIGLLKRALQTHNAIPCTTVAYSSVSDTHFDHQHRQDPQKAPNDRITQYLMSLGQLEPTHTEHLCVAAEREGNTAEQNKLIALQLRDALSHPDVTCQPCDKPAETSAHHLNTHLHQSHCSDKVQSCGQMQEKEHCDDESMWSEWSMRSGSTFDTRDEAAFRDGLSALDASIASLQKTIQLDLGR